MTCWGNYHFFFNFRHKKWLDLNQDIICIIKHNKKRLRKLGLAKAGHAERRILWVGQVSGRRHKATALWLDMAPPSFHPPGRYRGSADRIAPFSSAALRFQVVDWWCLFLATIPVFRSLAVRFTLAPRFIADWGLNCYKFRLNLNFSAEHWTPGKFPQERSFWMDLKIQHSCGLTTSQLKGAGFGFP